MLSKHGPSKLSRFFHAEFFTVNGLLMYVRHVSEYNTNVANVKARFGTILAQKCHIIHHKQFSCSEYSKQVKA